MLDECKKKQRRCLGQTKVVTVRLKRRFLICTLATLFILTLSPQAVTADSNSGSAATGLNQNFPRDSIGPIGFDLFQAMQHRADLAWLAESYLNNGLVDEYLSHSAKVRELDREIYYLQRIQALRDFSFGYTERLEAVWSAATGRTIQVVQRNQDEFWLFVDGRLVKNSLSLIELSKLAEQALGLR